MQQANTVRTYISGLKKITNHLGRNKHQVIQHQLNVQLIPIYGISIPIIIRSGEVQVSSSLNDLKLETQADGIQNLNFSINRTGNISVYGDIIVQYFSFTRQTILKLVRLRE